MIKRLTIENEFGNYVGSNLLDDEALCRGLRFDELNELTDVFNKLGQLEDIEEKLGISLIDLFTRSHCFVIVNGKIERARINVWKSWAQFYEDKDCGDYIDLFLLDDYGKVWSFNRDDLLDLVGDSND